MHFNEVVTIIDAYCFIDDADMLRHMINESQSKEYLPELCTITMSYEDQAQRTVTYPCFALNPSVDELLEPFTVMFRTCQTQTFNYVWRVLIKEKLGSTKRIPLRDIVDIFSNAVSECARIVKQLNELEITLLEVKRYFSQLESPERINEEVVGLTKALGFCQTEEIPKPDDTVIKKIELYCELCNYKEANKTLVQLREVLGLVKMESEETKVCPVLNFDSFSVLLQLITMLI